MCVALYASSGNLTHVKEYSITTSWARYVLTFAPDSDGTAFALVYHNSTNGWVLKER